MGTGGKFVSFLHCMFPFKFEFFPLLLFMCLAQCKIPSVFPLFLLMLIKGKVPNHVPTIYGQHYFIVQISLYHVLVVYLNVIVQSGHNRFTEHVPTQFPILVRMISFSRQVPKSINFKLLMVHSHLMLSQC
jgi:hypothetical protein